MIPELMTTDELIHQMRERAQDLRDGKERKAGAPTTSELLEVAADELESRESHDGE